MKRFIPAMEQAKKLLPSLGLILSTHMQTYQPWGDLWGANPASGFFHTPENGMSQIRQNYSGGILFCGGSHLIDLILFLLGRPHKLYATMRFPEERDYELQASAFFETDNGVVFFEALAHPHTKTGFLHDGWDESMKIIGVNGTLTLYSSAWDNVETKAPMLLHYDNDSGQNIEYLYEPESPFERAIKYFCDNIKNGCQGGQSRLTGYEVDEILEHFKQSASTGQPKEINYRI